MTDVTRSCSRSGCRWPAAASLSFRYSSRQVWLLDLGERDPALYDLCPQHADALVVPRGWSRVDQRTAMQVEHELTVADTPRRAAVRRHAEPGPRREREPGPRREREPGPRREREPGPRREREPGPRRRAQPLSVGAGAPTAVGTLAAKPRGITDERVRAGSPVDGGGHHRVNRYAELVKDLPRLAAEFGTRGELARAESLGGALARSSTAEDGVIVPIKIVRRPPPSGSEQ